MSLRNRTDEDLVADVKMLVAELSKMCVELARRGIESDLLSYQGGAVEIKNFERVKREAL